MSFWENASSATKGIIVLGAVLILALGGMYATGTGIYASGVDDETATQRGLSPQ